MPVKLRECELLAQLVAMAVVRVDVDRPLVEERRVQTVQLLANGFLPALDLSDPLGRIGLQFPPGVHHAILDEAHEASCWLQAREFLDEQLLEFGLADVHRTTAAAAVVVRVVLAASFRPARRQRFAARLASGVAAEREVRIVALLRRRHFVPAVQDSLHAEEDPLCDQRFEVAAS
ncbi:MAG TPA: hypothetical protein VGY48_25700 [Vicinamibacterales bacterium]|nr:hypothetical protein [Vicinamibacterales bacterium]